MPNPKKSRSTNPAPSGWRTVRFGDVVRNVNSIARNPQLEGIERFVGLEHIDPESLHIKRWGLVADGTTFTRKFTRGQVLFGKRRAYQRKVALANFDGICSSDILVFEPGNDELLPDLLPFIVESEGFFEHALGTSAGSLSPRTRWRDLAAYEFALPPKGEQHRIAEILWAAETAVRATETLLESSRAVKSASIESEVRAYEGVDSRRLGEMLLNIQYGTSVRSGLKEEGAVPVLGIPNVLKGRLDSTDLRWAALSQGEKQRYCVHEGDILLVRTNGNPTYVGRSVAVTNMPDSAVFASYLIRLQVDRTRVYPEYINLLLNSEYLRKTLNHEIRSSAGNYNINTVGLRRQRIPLLPLVAQKDLLRKMETINSAISSCEDQVRRSRALKSDLLNHMIGKQFGAT